MRDLGVPEPSEGSGSIADDELRLIFMCCHPALDAAVRVPLTLRSVCGLTTAEIAAAFLVPEPTMAQRLVRAKLRAGRLGAYQLQAAIAACHAEAPSAESTDWGEIAALYGALLQVEPTPVVQANPAVAVAMSEGPDAGLVILDTLQADPRLTRWPQLYVARAGLLARLGRNREAIDAYQTALELGPPSSSPSPERAFIAKRIRELAGG